METYPQKSIKFFTIHFAPLCNSHILRVARLFAVEEESSPYGSFLLKFIQQQLHLEICPIQSIQIRDILSN